MNFDKVEYLLFYQNAKQLIVFQKNQKQKKVHQWLDHVVEVDKYEDLSESLLL